MIFWRANYRIVEVFNIYLLKHKTTVSLHILHLMANPLSNLEERLRKAAAGDADSLEFFGIKDGFKYSCPNTWSAATSSKDDLEEALKDAIIFAEAANRLHLDTAEKIARSAIQHMTHSYFCLFDKMPREVNAVYHGKQDGTPLTRRHPRYIQTTCLRSAPS